MKLGEIIVGAILAGLMGVLIVTCVHKFGWRYAGIKELNSLNDVAKTNTNRVKAVEDFIEKKYPGEFFKRYDDIEITIAEHIRGPFPAPYSRDDVDSMMKNTLEEITTMNEFIRANAPLVRWADLSEFEQERLLLLNPKWKEKVKYEEKSEEGQEKTNATEKRIESL